MANSEHKTWDQTTGAKVLAVVLVAIVGVVGFAGKGNQNGPQQVVQRFFDTLNEANPTATEFTRLVSGTTSTKIREAIRNRPAGTYSVSSIGDPINSRQVPVTFRHGDEEFSVTLAVRKVSGDWRVVDPFVSVRFVSQTPDVSFELNPTSTDALRLNRTYVLFPGVHTIGPLPSTPGEPVIWEPAQPRFKAVPGSPAGVEIEPRITPEANTELTAQVTESLSDCLASSILRPTRCPNRVTPPAEANPSPNVSWTFAPATTPLTPQFLTATSVQQPCFRVEGSLTYEYTTRTADRQTRSIDRWVATGRVDLSSDIVDWQ